MKTFNDLVKKFLLFFIRYPFAIAVTVFIILFALFLAIGGKNIQIGGILSKLWGKKEENDNGIKVIPPNTRIDDSGKIIEPGVSDNSGFVQVKDNIEIKDPGLFSDPTKLIVIHPEKGEMVIPLPKGVSNTDVKQIVEVKPDVYQVSNEDRPSINTSDLLKNLP